MWLEYSLPLVMAQSKTARFFNKVIDCFIRVYLYNGWLGIKELCTLRVLYLATPLQG